MIELEETPVENEGFKAINRTQQTPGSEQGLRLEPRLVVSDIVAKNAGPGRTALPAFKPLEPQRRIRDKGKKRYLDTRSNSWVLAP